MIHNAIENRSLEISRGNSSSVVISGKNISNQVNTKK